MLNGPSLSSDSFVGTSLPAVYACGNGSEIVRVVRASDRAGNSRVLFLPDCSIRHFDFTQQCKRRWQRVRIDHQRE
jgi:hypothetical protein